MKPLNPQIVSEIEVCGSHEPHCRFPLRLGVPFARGVVHSVKNLRLIPQDGPIPVQARPLLHWPDGSVKWALLDWEGAFRRAQVAYTGDPQQIPLPDVVAPVVAKQLADRVTVRSPFGGHEFVENQVLTSSIAISLEDDSGTRLEPNILDVTLVEQGPLRASIRLTGEFCKNSKCRSRLRWQAVVDFFACQALQRWTVTFRNPQRAQHPGGIWEIGDAGSIKFRSLSIGVRADAKCDGVSYSLKPNESPQLCSSVAIHQASSGGDHWRSSNHANELGDVALPFRGFEVVADGQTHHGDRADPIVTLNSNSPILSVYPEQFWMNFPKRIESHGDTLELHLFPAQGEPHELQGGEQKTHRFWIAEQPAAAESATDMLRSPPTARVTPDAFAKTKAIPFATSLGARENSDYRALVTKATQGEQSFFAKREVIDEYGWRHFGDVYGDHEAAFADPEPPLVSHWNNQYDLVFGLGVRYLRGGDSDWFRLMEDMAWHVTDIDIYHTDEDKSAYNHGLFWHTVHYLDAGLANHRSYPRGTVGGGPCSEHAYARGLLLYYCLTGEPAIRDAVIELGQWILDMEDGSRTPFRWLASSPTGLSSASGSPMYHGPGRGPGNATETLLAAFELTGERRFLDRVEELMRRVVHPNEDIESLELLDAERKWFYNLYLQALGRYLEVKIDLEELDESYAYGRESLLHYARWMAQHEYPYLSKPELLEFPTETWAAQDMRKSEVFNFAARHSTHQTERQQFLDKAREYYEYSVSTLSRMETSHFCRPIALLLGCGFSYDGFRTSDTPAPPPAANVSNWPTKPAFIPQKQLAIARFRRLAIGGAALAGMAGVLAIALMLAK